MKYILHSDIRSIIKKYYILIMYFGIILLNFLLSSKNYSSLNDIILSSLALNINFKQSLVLEIMTYLVSISCMTFLITDLYLKDFQDQLDNIFMRMKLKEWIVKKVLYLLFLILIIQLIVYLVITLILSFIYKYNINIFDIVNIFITNYLYIIIFQFIVLLYCIIINIYHKKSIINIH